VRGLYVPEQILSGHYSGLTSENTVFSEDNNIDFPVPQITFINAFRTLTGVFDIQLRK
jgi:hypothetical protein